MGPENAAGHYTSFNYFQTVDTPENKSFVERYKAKYGANQVTNAVMKRPTSKPTFSPKRSRRSDRPKPMR